MGPINRFNFLDAKYDLFIVFMQWSLHEIYFANISTADYFQYQHHESVGLVRAGAVLFRSDVCSAVRSAKCSLRGL